MCTCDGRGEWRKLRAFSMAQITGWAWAFLVLCVCGALVVKLTLGQADEKSSGGRTQKNKSKGESSMKKKLSLLIFSTFLLVLFYSSFFWGGWNLCFPNFFSADSRFLLVSSFPHFAISPPLFLPRLRSISQSTLQDWGTRSVAAGKSSESRTNLLCFPGCTAYK